MSSLVVKKNWIEVDKSENKGNINRQRQILGGKNVENWVTVSSRDQCQKSPKK